MKKHFKNITKVILLSMITLTLAVSEELNLDNRKLVEKFGANILKEKIDSYDP